MREWGGLAGGLHGVTCAQHLDTGGPRYTPWSLLALCDFSLKPLRSLVLHNSLIVFVLFLPCIKTRVPQGKHFYLFDSLVTPRTWPGPHWLLKTYRAGYQLLVIFFPPSFLELALNCWG